MDDVGDLAIVEDALELGPGGDVALDERDTAYRRLIHDLVEPTCVRAEVEAHDLRVLGDEHPCRPGAEAAEDARDEEALAQ